MEISLSEYLHPITKMRQKSGERRESLRPSHCVLFLIIIHTVPEKSKCVTATHYCVVVSLNNFTIADLIIYLSQVFLLLSSVSLVISPCKLYVCVFCRALSSASVMTATPESSVRNLTPATTAHVATTAPALMSDKEAKDATSAAPASQVCVRV